MHAGWGFQKDGSLVGEGACHNENCRSVGYIRGICSKDIAIQAPLRTNYLLYMHLGPLGAISLERFFGRDKAGENLNGWFRSSLGRLLGFCIDAKASILSNETNPKHFPFVRVPRQGERSKHMIGQQSRGLFWGRTPKEHAPKARQATITCHTPCQGRNR